jgi:hypothetical protein
VASDGSRGPKPYTQHQASTAFLRVPAEDWPAVKGGFKTEFRAQPGKSSGAMFTDLPTPVVAWSYSRVSGHDAQLMILLDRFTEPLMAISPESLEREGHPSIAHFRRFIMRRERKRFDALKEATAYVLRPFEPGDLREQADRLLERLYGDFLPAAD